MTEKQHSALAVQITELAALNDLRKKHEFNEQFLCDNVSDLKVANEKLREKLALIEDNNKLLCAATKDLHEKTTKADHDNKHLQEEVKFGKEKLAVTAERCENLSKELLRQENALEELKKLEIAEKERLKEMALKHEEYEKTNQEIVMYQKKLAEQNSLFELICQKEREMEAKKLRELEIEAELTTKINLLKRQNENMKSEMLEVSGNLIQKEVFNSTLLQEKKNLENLTEGFGKLRAKYSDKLNEKAAKKEVLAKKIIEDNSRIDMLSQDVDKTLSMTRNLFR